MICITCKEEVPEDKISGATRYCKPCVNKRTKQWKLDNPEKWKATQRQSRHGISDSMYQRLISYQMFRCGICREVWNPSSKRFAIDHDHKTGKTRGLLCVRCNVGLGYMRDNPEILRSAIEYLEQWSRLNTQKEIE